MHQNITILTGSKGCGKTTSLLNYCNTHKNVVGILTPIINNKRCFYNILSKDFFAMKYASEANDEAISVGKYLFSSNAFSKANLIFQNIDTGNNQVIIDEIGPLELRGEGFANSLKQLLQKDFINLILVVREELIDEVIKYFALQNVQIVTKNYFLTA